MTTTIYFPGLALAARRLGIDRATETEIAEATLSAMDAGYSEAEAMRMTLVESLRRKVRYNGLLKIMVDTGVVFQMEDGANADGSGNRKHGRQASDDRRGRLADGRHAASTSAFAGGDVGGRSA